jgi:hypothetical protein
VLATLSPHSRGLVTEAFAAVQMGWPGLAGALLAHLERGELGRPRFLALRTWLQEELGITHRAARSPAARRCRAALDENPAVDEDVRECWHKVFPMPFAPLIDRVRGELPATVFWSIMRQESYYHPRARSHADALGLMQLVPQVGEPAAAGLGRPFDPFDPFDPFELYQPETNLTLFATAARERAERFSGHLPLLLLSYNASPGKTLAWLRDNRNLPFDLFVEEIPWSETREYIKQISCNLARYETLLEPAGRELLSRAHLPHPEAQVAWVFRDVLDETRELAAAR